MFPMDTPAGTGATICVLLQLRGVAAMPLKLTVLLPCVLPKLIPLMATAVPTPPAAGVKLLMDGATEKDAELAMPPTVAATISGPGCSPKGTVAVMLVLFQLLGVTVTPPKLSVLEPWVMPKPDPFNVTAVPAAPDVGAMLGAAATVNCTPLLVSPWLTSVKVAVPAVCPDGTVSTTWVLLQLLGFPNGAPPQATTPLPLDPRFNPLTVIMVPGDPPDGFTD